jgi:hypothetical protein
MRVRNRVAPKLPVDPREARLDRQSARLVENIRSTLKIQNEMFRRILSSTPKPSVLLAEVLEDAGNRYIDFSELVSAASARASSSKSKNKQRACAANSKRASYKLKSKA